MSDTASTAPRRDLLRIGLILFAVYWLVLGLWMAVSPHSFFDVIGPFGHRNDHYTRDNATWSLAMGIGVLVAVRRPGWRAPVLTLAVAQAALHFLNHLLDVGKADPGWVGPFDAVALGGLTLFAIGLLRGSPDAER